MTNSKVNRIKKAIDLNKVPAFIQQARDAANAAESALNSSVPDDDKLVQIWDSCVRLGLYDETDLPH